eukprot:629566-Pleurochrysis_carterae.AAC.1
MEGQGMPSADLVAVHCDVPVKVTSLGASQDAERKPQAVLKAPAKGCEMDMKVVACLRDVAVA